MKKVNKKKVFVKTECLPADKEGIFRASEILRKGGLVAFPTETVYGLGANALDPEAVEQIFLAKGRPMDNPMIVHIPRLEDAGAYGEWTDLARLLAVAFWPGPLTVIVPRKTIIPKIVSAGLPSVALRCPSHKAALALLETCGLPIAAPSANRSGRPSPTTAKHVMDDLDGLIPLVLDGGACEVGLESTVVDASGAVPVILRPGAVTPEMIAMAVGDCKVSENVMRLLEDGEAALSPGMKHRHYAPKAKLTLIKGEQEAVSAIIRCLAADDQGAWVFAMEENIPRYLGLQVKSLGYNAEDAAHRLFYLLRQADEANVTRILSETLPENGLGLAVMNRLARAANFDIIDAQHPKTDK